MFFGFGIQGSLGFALGDGCIDCTLGFFEEACAGEGTGTVDGLDPGFGETGGPGCIGVLLCCQQY